MKEDDEKALLRHYLAIDQEDLYGALIPQSEALLFSSKDAPARGRQIFQSIGPRVGGPICRVYHQHNGIIENPVDMAAAVAERLKLLPWKFDVSVLVFAALAVRSGLDKVCEGNNKNGDPFYQSSFLSYLKHLTKL